MLPSRILPCMVDPNKNNLLNRYGPAWVISVQLVGWFFFFLLWLILIVAGTCPSPRPSFLSLPHAQPTAEQQTKIDIHPTAIADYFQLTPPYRHLISVFGLPAAAYTLNRVIFPLRLVCEIALVRRIHAPVNAVLRPWWDWAMSGIAHGVGWEVQEGVAGSEEEADALEAGAAVASGKDEDEDGTRIELEGFGRSGASKEYEEDSEALIVDDDRGDWGQKWTGEEDGDDDDDTLAL
ncbi:hypothetical protein BC830DRAFT_1157007 [Chytriomyces sp. MP71]|nr:hypothetical protein BC830DRAFT_1157007 [Chytriomyces sp. MP71]